MVSKIRSRKTLQQDLLKRSQESYDKKDESGRYGSFFKSKSELGNKEFWKCGEGEHQIDIIPWIAGDNYPTKSYDIKSGDIAIVLDLWVHYNVGPNEDSVVCPARNYGLPCPICEHINEIRKRDDLTEDEIKEKTSEKNPKRRSIYQIVCYDSHEEESKGVQIWDVAHFFMERHLTELSQKPKRGGFIPYADPDEGKQVYFKRKGQGQFNTEYMAHQFLDREYKVSDEVLDSTISLDQGIIVLTYEELKRKYWGGEDIPATSPEEEEEQPKATRATRRPPVQEEEEPETEERQPDEEEEQQEPEEQPTRRRVRKPQQEEQPEEEEENGNKCPAGGVFGKDIDKPLPECDDCKVWDDCAAEADRLEKGGK